MDSSSRDNLLRDARIVRLREVLGPEAALCIVGGTIRDALLARPTSADLDLATALFPNVIIERLEAAGIRTIPTGLKHQTVTALPDPNLGAVEITTFRGPNLRPGSGVVASSSIDEDLGYRDFTINALALEVDSARFIDPFDGRCDLTDRLVRAVGNPHERFSEDPLRILRMVRLSAELGFTIDLRTWDAAVLQIGLLQSVSTERIRDELMRILLSDDIVGGFHRLQQLDVLQNFLPEIERMVGFEQNSFHKDKLFEHTLEVVRRTRANLTLRLAALFHDVGKVDTLSIDSESGERHFFKHESVGVPIARAALLRLKFPHRVIEDVCTLVATHMRPLNAGSGGLRRILRDTEGVYDLWRELKEADACSCRIEEGTIREQLTQFDLRLEEVRKGPTVSPLRSLAIDGQDLIKLGYSPGPIFKEILLSLHELVLDDPELNTRERLLGIVTSGEYKAQRAR